MLEELLKKKERDRFRSCLLLQTYICSYSLHVVILWIYSLHTLKLWKFLPYSVYVCMCVCVYCVSVCVCACVRALTSDVVFVEPSLRQRRSFPSIIKLPVRSRLSSFNQTIPPQGSSTQSSQNDETESPLNLPIYLT